MIPPKDMLALYSSQSFISSIRSLVHQKILNSVLGNKNSLFLPHSASVSLRLPLRQPRRHEGPREVQLEHVHLERSRGRSISNYLANPILIRISVDYGDLIES